VTIPAYEMPEQYIMCTFDRFEKVTRDVQTLFLKHVVCRRCTDLKFWIF